MAQRRMLSRRISQSQKVNRLPIKTQLIYTWTIPWLDDYGCYTGDPEDIKTEVFPKNKKISTKDIEDALKLASEAGLILWYKVLGEFVQQYRNFDNFQTFKIDRERKAEYPQFDPENEGMVPIGNQDIPVDSIVPLKLSKVKLSKVKLSKNRYLDCILLTKIEYQKLIDKFGKETTKEKIETLNDYIMSKGKKYSSHYHTILNFDRRNTRTQEQKTFKPAAELEAEYAKQKAKGKLKT